jgi:hypothetical protein
MINGRSRRAFAFLRIILDINYENSFIIYDNPNVQRSRRADVEDAPMSCRRADTRPELVSKRSPGLGTIDLKGHFQTLYRIFTFRHPSLLAVHDFARSSVRHSRGSRG